MGVNLDDIEDMIGQDELDRTNAGGMRAPIVAPKNIATRTKTTGVQAATLVPGTQSIWLKTYGCSHNVSDSEYMQGVLASYGYQFTHNPEEAQLW
jgi:threonylcarbamoyladenosine tRNA methylthiotransferase CDKAL1